MATSIIPLRAYDVDISNRLAVLAADIRAEHEAAQRSSLDAAEHAYRAGEMLAEAKGDPSIPRGGWERWVQQETGIPLQTARHYVRLFHAVEQQSLTLADIVEAGQIGAMRAIRDAEGAARRARSRAAAPILDDLDLRIGDCREVLADVPDNSVPLILTDPPYGDEAEPLYGWLAEFAARVLIPGGSLICYTGHSRLDRDMAILSERLRYWWLLVMPHDQAQRLAGKFVIVNFKPVLWYVKEFRRGRSLVPDMLLSPKREKEQHNWGQGDGGVGPLIEHLTDPGELIVDPFAGTGTWGKRAHAMGRQWLGADIVAGGVDDIVA